VIGFTAKGVRVGATAVAALREEFRERQFVRLPGLLAGPLLNRLLDMVDRGAWDEHVQADLDSEAIIRSGPALNTLHFLANEPAFLALVHQITNAGPFSWFGGRVYRLAPGGGHYDSWHDDNTDGRLVAMSVNLSRNGYEGGVFQMRKRDSPELLVELANTGLGDATLFRVSEHYVHRVTDIRGREARTAFAGWFRAAQPSLVARLKAQAWQSASEL